LVFDVNGSAVSTYAGSTLVLSGSNIDIAIVTGVPEPGTWALMLGGLALLIGYQRSRSKRVS